MDLSALASATRFYADFDHGFDATYSQGDGRVRLEREAYPPTLTVGGGGRFGEAVEFHYEVMRESIWTTDVLRYPAAGNFPYRRGQFGGTIGMWLQVDMEDLQRRSLIWLDPVHLLGPGAGEQGKMWMDFVVSELPGSPLFRFGATLPQDMRQEPGNSEEGNIIIIPGLRFTKEEWHQVIGSWAGINGDGRVGCLQLYVDGRAVGQLTDFDHRLDWAIEAWEIRIGLGFKGRIDDFFILDRPMAPDEVVRLYESGVSFGSFVALSGLGSPGLPSGQAR